MNLKPASNSSRLFHFKQFSLCDEGCAMKIGTDGVLLGSIAAKYPAALAMDIGSGCGLIAHMIAQETDAKVIALEPEKAAVATALENVAQSPWPHQIKVIQTRFQDYVPEQYGTFDLIVCNPPYFRNSLRSPDEKRNLARHADSLPFEDLFKGVSKMINPRGVFLLILPTEEQSAADVLALKYGLHCQRRINIYPRPGRLPKRIILVFSPLNSPLIIEELIIAKREGHFYTAEYRELTAKFYLDF